MSQAPAAVRSPWIISPAWDLACIIATPLVIFPALLLLSDYVLTPEMLAVVVLSFASFGHHLPGFLRAYGDRELFRRYRWRFLLAPPLIALVVVYFSTSGLHGFALVLMVWATWHILMQTYGFLRIYDARRGRVDPWSARLDYLACVAIFVGGIVFSDARVYGFAQTLWLTGVPLFGPAQLAALRWAVGILTAGVAVAYLAHLLATSRTAGGVSWPKLLLLLSTGLFYWASGRLATNILVGVAMFEVFHAVQYFAIVWTYNRRAASHSADRLRAVRWLFQPSALSVALYLAAIGAFGATFFAFRSSEPAAIGATLFTLPSMESATLKQVLLAAISGATLERVLLVVFSTSACLHFYYDGFIWRIRESETRADLELETKGSARPRVNLPQWRHAAKWAALAAVSLGLVALERLRVADRPAEEERMQQALANLTPDLPEAQAYLSRAALRRGDVNEAVEIARRIVAMRPRSHAAHGDLGAALLKAGRYDEAAAELRTAVQLAPQTGENHFELAQALQAMGRRREAEAAYQIASRLAPGNADVHRTWAAMYVQLRDYDAAARHYQAAVNCCPDAIDVRAKLAESLSHAGRHGEAIRAAEEAVGLAPDSTAAQLALGSALIADARYAEALPALNQAVAGDATSPEAFYQRGVARMQTRQSAAALEDFQQALRLDADHLQSNFQVGNLEYFAGDLDAAAERFQRCGELDPKFHAAFKNLGAVYFEQARFAEAREAYQRAIEIEPDDGALQYNLGILYLQEGDLSRARRHILRAQALGQPPSPNVAQALGLDGKRG